MAGVARVPRYPLRKQVPRLSGRGSRDRGRLDNSLGSTLAGGFTPRPRGERQRLFELVLRVRLLVYHWSGDGVDEA